MFNWFKKNKDKEKQVLIKDENILKEVEKDIAVEDVKKEVIIETDKLKEEIDKEEKEIQEQKRMKMKLKKKVSWKNSLEV